MAGRVPWLVGYGMGWDGMTYIWDKMKRVALYYLDEIFFLFFYTWVTKHLTIA